MAGIPVGTAVGYLTLDYSEFSKNLKTAVGEASSLSNKFSDTLGEGLQTVGDKISTVGTTITTGVTVPLATAAASSVKFGAEFDKQMSAVKSVTNATEEDFEDLRDSAIDWGEKTVYTATEAGEALYYMGLAGWDAKTSIAALGPVLNLAAAGNLDLGRASDIVTDAMTAMKVEAGELTDGIENTEHFTNVLAATMANSNTDVDLLGESFKYVAPLAGALNYDIRDLALGMGLMANVGVKGTQAGTGLRQALKNLVAPTEEMQYYMDEYGVSMYDANGNAKSMRQLMEELRETFGDLSLEIYDASGELKSAEDIMEEYGHSLPTTQQEKLNAIVEIFGTRALPGVLGIIEQSEENFNSLADAIDGADTAFDGLGYATGMAETQMDNLQGDWTKFTSALGTTQIVVSDFVKDDLRKLVQELTKLLNTFNNLDPKQQEAIIKFLGMAAAVGPVILIIGKLISGIGTLIITISQISGAITKITTGFTMLTAHISELTSLFGTLGGTAGTAEAGTTGLATALGGISATVAAVVAVILVLIAAFATLWSTNEEFRNNITAVWDEIKQSFDEAGQSIVDTLNEVGFDFENIEEVITTAVEGIKTVWLGFCDLLAPAFVGSFETLATEIDFLLGEITSSFEIVMGLIKGITEGDWSLFFKGFEDKGANFLEFVTGFADSTNETIWNMISTVAGWFDSDWDYTWDEAKTAMSDMLDDGITNIGDFIDDSIEWFSELPDNISQFFDEAGETISGWADTAVENAATAGEEFVQNVEDFFDDLPYKVGYYIGLAAASIVEWKDDTIENAKELGEEFITNIQEWFEQLPGKVEEFTDETRENIDGFVEDVLDGSKELGEEFINNTVEWCEKLPGEVETWLDETVETVADWVVEMGEKGEEAISELITNVKEAAEELPEKVEEIGTNIVTGVWQGVKNARDTFYTNVTSFFTGVVDGVKAGLGIHSPSTVMAEQVGMWLPPGVTEGVEKAMPEAISNISTIIDDGISDISPDAEFDTSLDNFTNKYESTFMYLITWFQGIEQSFTNSIDNMTDYLLRLIDVYNSLQMLNDIANQSGMSGTAIATMQDSQNMQLVSMLTEALSEQISNLAANITGGSGNGVIVSDNVNDIIIPINIAGEDLDPVIVTAQQRNDYRSGGRDNGMVAVE